MVQPYLGSICEACEEWRINVTRREQEVISMVVSGMLTKKIASQLGTAENTVKVHRRRAMEKMQAESLAELIRMIERLKGPLPNVA